VHELDDSVILEASGILRRRIEEGDARWTPRTPREPALAR
jgi:hypothetical protein